MKECELCKKPARMHCDSDQASLCLACDAKVHSANFLVARHSRTLLCQSCQAPTPWKAAGARLLPAISVCLKCVGRCRVAPAQEIEVSSGERMVATEEEEEEETDSGGEEDVEAEDVEEQEEDEKGDGENQVVPWTSSLSGPAASPSSVEESFKRDGRHGWVGIGKEIQAIPSMKRRRDDGDSLHQESNGCSSQGNCSVTDDEATSSAPSMSPKELRKIPGDSEGAARARRLRTDILNGHQTTTVELSKGPLHR